MSNDREKEWDSIRKDFIGSDSDGEEQFEERESLIETKQKRKPQKRGATKQPKAKQQTIAESLKTSVDLDNVFNKFKEDEGVNDDVDFAAYMKNDEDEAYENDVGEYNASTFMASLTNDKSSIHATTQELDVPPIQEPNVLDFEQTEYEFETTKAKGKKRIKKETCQEDQQSGYLAVEKPKKEIKLVEKVKPEVADIINDSALIKEEPSDENLFYWFDAKEQPHDLSVDPGSIFLFGKRRTVVKGRPVFSSCCVRVRNVDRVLYILPNEESTEEAVVKEINDLCRQYSIEQRRIRFVEKYYAFEEANVPQGKRIWVELRYPGRYPPIILRKKGTNISTVVGSSYSLLERFLLEKKIMGPCTLNLGSLVPATIRISHCHEEFLVDDPGKIFVEEGNVLPPPFTVCSVQLHSQLNDAASVTEISVVSLAVYKNVNLEGSLRTTPDEIHTGVRPIGDSTLSMDLESFCNRNKFNGVQRFSNESLLLKWCATKLGAIDADIVIGHNVLGFTINTLLRRYQDLNIPNWSTLGRLDLKRFPKLHGQSTAQEKEVCIGRMIADSYLLSREYFKSVNYKLSSLGEQMGIQGLVEGTMDFEPGVSVITPELQKDTKKMFEALIQVGNSAVLSAGIISHLDAIRLTKRLTTIAGNLWSHTLYGGRSERIEYLLLHTFYNLDFILPDKKAFEYKRSREEGEGEEGKRKAKYQGGMVLDPKCGLYSDYILLLDFNSLYPSLIQEFNICFTTVERQDDEEAVIPSPENLICASCAEKGLPAPCQHKCVLPKVIKSLVDSRREVKRLMKTEKDPNNLALLEIRQKSLKLTANSMYGCLGFEHSRFYAPALAELVTRQGRLALQSTVELVPTINSDLRVIYGDTDSVMIQTGIKTNIKEVRDMGLDIKNKVNKRYQSLEIDIDGVFRAILLLKKKKYAALSVIDWEGEGKVIKKEVKGLDMVRRDWCPLSKKVSDAVLNRILYAEGAEDILDYIMNYMRDVADHVRLGDRYTLDDFVISKSLTKEPEAYRGSTFPHASVALRMKQRKEMVRVGDLIPYVICVGSEKLSEKAYHVEEVRKDAALRLDSEWYLSSQIYPPVIRLCEHIQGFSNAQLSEAMGIAYHGSATNQTENRDGDGEGDFSHCSLFKNVDLSECFPSCLRVQVLCIFCHRRTPIDPHKRVLDYIKEVEQNSRSLQQFDLYTCSSCHKSLPVEYVANCFTQMCHRIMEQFYRSGGGPRAVHALRNQFTYFRALFDVPQTPGCPSIVKQCHREYARRCIGMVKRELLTLAQAELRGLEDDEDPIDPLHYTAEAWYKRIEFLFIDLNNLFN